KSILRVLFSLSLLVGCLLASPTCLHCVLPCFASSCYCPCPALPRTCSNLEEDYNLSIENILAKTLSDSPNEKEKRITTFTVQLAKASIGYGMLNWLHL
ncbi:hypothetical protein S83_004984, partial [Arachis hypogaea]